MNVYWAEVYCSVSILKWSGTYILSALGDLTVYLRKYGHYCVIRPAPRTDGLRHFEQVCSISFSVRYLCAVFGYEIDLIQRENA